MSFIRANTRDMTESWRDTDRVPMHSTNRTNIRYSGGSYEWPLIKYVSPELIPGTHQLSTCPRNSPGKTPPPQCRRLLRTGSRGGTGSGGWKHETVEIHRSRPDPEACDPEAWRLDPMRAFTLIKSNRQFRSPHPLVTFVLVCTVLGSYFLWFLGAGEAMFVETKNVAEPINRVYRAYAYGTQPDEIRNRQRMTILQHVAKYGFQTHQIVQPNTPGACTFYWWPWHKCRVLTARPQIFEDPFLRKMIEDGIRQPCNSLKWAEEQAANLWNTVKKLKTLRRAQSYFKCGGGELSQPYDVVLILFDPLDRKSAKKIWFRRP